MLLSEDPATRLAGARLLSNAKSSASIAEIRQLRKVESDSWVRNALDKIIHRLESATGAADVGEAWISVASADDLQDLRLVAIQSVTRTLLHEIQPLVGDINTAARRDIGEGYPDSLTARRVQRLGDLLATVKTLHDAAAAPRWVEFDLADLIAREIADGGFSKNQILAMRTDSVVATGDPDLLSLALQNAFRNAVEASESTSKPVVVNCGSSSTEAWVSVLDEGVGLPEASERVWEPGITKKSKDRHFGWGLTIAQQAIHSLGGSIKLQPREHGGAACEIRWQNKTSETVKTNEDTVS
jgi:signal transduction histidine kinase